MGFSPVNNGSPSGSPPSDNDNNLAQALAAIQKQLSDELTWIQQMKDDADQIAKDRQALKTQIYDHHHSGWWIFTDSWTTVNTNLKSQLNNDISAKTQDLKSLEAKLNACGFSDLDSAIDRLLQGLSDAQGNAHHHTDGSIDRFKQDVSQITAFLNTIFQTMLARAQLNANEAEANLDDGSGKIDLQSLVFNSISQMTQMNSLLTQLEGTADQDISTYNTDSSNAQVEKNGVHWWNEWFGDGYETESKDNNIIANANQMMKLFVGLESDLSPALAASSMSDFTQISMTINSIVKRLLAILNDKSLTPDERNEKLKAAAMEMFVIVVGLIGLVDQMANKDKNQSDADMSKANGQAAQMGIVSQQAKQRMLEQDKEYAKIMGVIMKVAEFTVGIAMAAITGGAAGFLMAALTVADTAFNLTDKLAAACGGGVGGAAAAAAIEMVATCGVGSAMEAGAKVAMKAATKSVMEGVENTLKTTLQTTIKAAVEQAAAAGSSQIIDLSERAGQEGLEEGIEMAEMSSARAGQTAATASETAVKEGIETVENTARIAGKTAAEKVFDQIFRENGLSIIFRALKEGVLTKGTQALEAMAKPAMEAAAKEAAESSIKASAEVMTTLGKVADFTATEAKQFDKAAEEAANQAVAKVRNITPEKAAKIAPFKSVGRSVAAYGAKAAAIGLTYGVAQTHLTTEIAKAKGDEDQTLQMVLGILDTLMTLVTTMLSGNFDYSMGSIMNGLTKAGRGLQAAGTGAEAYSNEQLWQNGLMQGDATSAIGSIQSGLDVLNTMVQPAINNRQKDATQQDSKDAEFAFQTTAALADSLWKYADTAARELQA